MSETRRFTAEELQGLSSAEDLREHLYMARQALRQAAESEQVLAELREWAEKIEMRIAKSESVGVEAARAEVRAILGRVKP